MSQADDFIGSFLAHDCEGLVLAHRTDEPYNPAKRREYYLKTRQLKGRPTGTKVETNNATSSKRVPVKAIPKRPSPKKVDTAALQKQVDEMKTRLAELRRILAELVEKAKARSGVEDPKDDPKTSKSGGNSNKPQKTEQQKAEDAKKAQEYYEKNKDKILSDQVKELGEKLKLVAQKIQEMREKLAEPVKRPLQTTRRPGGVGPTNR